jgi:TPR repeat protein
VSRQRYYGLLLFTGDGVPTDKSQALPYLKLAADRGFLHAEFVLTWLW